MPKNFPQRAKKIIAELIRNPEHDPILIDENIISTAGNKDIFSLCRDRILPQIDLKELKATRLYFSCLYSLIEEYQKIKTVSGVIEENTEFIDDLKKFYASREFSYERHVKIAMMRQARSRNVKNARTLKVLSELRRIVSESEKIHQTLALRSSIYNAGNNAFGFVRERVEKAAKTARRQGKLYEVSETDVDLVTAAFYETLFWEKTPLILSLDKDISIIRTYSIPSFETEKRGFLIEGVRTYRDLEKRVYTQARNAKYVLRK